MGARGHAPPENFCASQSYSEAILSHSVALNQEHFDYAFGANLCTV